MEAKFEVFVHIAGSKPRIVEAEAGEVLRDLLLRAEAIAADGDDTLVFVGLCEEALQEPEEIEDGEDQHGPVDIQMSIDVLDLGRHRHVHVHRCRHVAVEVNFLTKTKRHRFSPATTVGTATAWARKKFRIDPATAHDYVLRVCQSMKQPRPDEHLGELVTAPHCSLCFDLVKEVTPQG